jgi:hypothetical protein
MKVFIGNYPKKSGKRKVRVEISDHDVWSLDNTLAYVIHPALVKLRDAKAGSPFVDDEDVPENLRRSAAPPTENEWETDDNFHARWVWVLNEMIFAFEMKNTDWEDQFWKRYPKLDFKEYPEDEGQDFKPVRWEDEGDCDHDARRKFEERIQNGFRLFGKYYQALWT